MPQGQDQRFDEAHRSLTFAVVALGLMGAAIGIAAATLPADPVTPVEQVLVHEHAGYVLRDAGQVVGNAWPLPARIALVSVVALLPAAALGILLSRLPLTRSGAWSVARWTLVTLLAWGLFAVFFLPPRTLSVTPNGLRLGERTALFGQLSLPVPALARSAGRAEVAGVAAHLAPSGDTLRVTLVDGGTMDLLLPHRDGAASAFVASALHDHLTRH
jgi:hypothetical protein